jgi:antitoxin FitA
VTLPASAALTLGMTLHELATNAAPNGDLDVRPPACCICYRFQVDAMTAMAQLLVRNIDDDLLRRLKMRAVAAGRSAEAEHRMILEQVLRPDVETFKERARQLRERTKGRCTAEAWELIRADRDRDYSSPDDDADDA